MDSFARRFYREAASPSKLWWAAAVVLILVFAVSGWYFFSRSAVAPPFRPEGMSIRKLSQSNNVAYASIAPDGRSIVYVTYEDNGDRALWLRRISDANAIQIVAPQPVQYWDCPLFSNDGDSVYYITAARSATHGWVMVNAPELSQRAVMDALDHGDFYSSTGVELESYAADKNTVVIAVKKERWSKYNIQFIGRGGKVLAESFESPAKTSNY